MTETSEKKNDPAVLDGPDSSAHTTPKDGSNEQEKLYSALYEISEAAHSKQNLDDLYQSIYAIVARLMPLRNFYIAQYESSTDTVTFPCWIHDFESRPTPRRGGMGKTEFILKTGQPFLEDTRHFNEAIRKGEYQQIGQKCGDWMGVPLKAMDKVIGVLGIQSPPGIRYSEEEKNILTFVSEQVANAINRKRTEVELRESREELMLITDGLPALVAHIGIDNRYLYANKAYASWYSVSREDIIGRHEREVIGDKAFQTSQRYIKDVLRGERVIYECNIKSPRGKEKILDITCVPQLDEAGNVKAYFTLAQDITERKKGEAALLESEERYALAVRGANDGIWDWDLRTDKIYYSPRLKRMLGYNEDEIGNTPDEWFNRIHLQEASHVNGEIQSYLNGMIPHLEIEHRIRHKDGTYRWVSVRGLAVRDPGQKTYRMAGSFTDITTKKNTEERLRHDAMHDHLTGLPNRAYFMDQLRRSIDRIKRSKKHLSAILFMDLDRFKIVNDSLGHDAGDLLLKEIAQRLLTCIRPSDTVARFGGDEFAILLDGINASSTAIRIAERIKQKIDSPFHLRGHEIFMTTSIGIVLTNIYYEQAEDLLRDADSAMYRAKNSGRNTYEIFDANMHAQSMAELQMEADLRRALENKELRLVYQPIINLSDRSIMGVEALLRWDHPERGLVMPDEFITIAEETGMIIPIGNWVLETACSQLQTWHKEGLPLLKMTVNISARQIQDVNYVKNVNSILASAGLQHSSLQFDIRENALLSNVETISVVLSELNQLGIQIMMDDFGTSYSSLSYLKRLPVGAIKIDHTFIQEAGNNNGEALIVKAMISMAHILNLGVIAEGVETIEQLEFLIDHGCDQVQGFLFCGSQPADAISALLQTGKCLEPA